MSYVFEFEPEVSQEISDAEELMCAPEGEYMLEVVEIPPKDEGSIFRSDKNGNTYVFLKLRILDGAYKSFKHMVYLPTPDMKPEDRVNALFGLKTLEKVFSIKFQGNFDFRNLIDRKFQAILTVQENDVYGDQNRISQFSVSH